jgi:hypothetical protein
MYCCSNFWVELKFYICVNNQTNNLYRHRIKLFRVVVYNKNTFVWTCATDTRPACVTNGIALITRNMILLNQANWLDLLTWSWEVFSSHLVPNTDCLARVSCGSFRCLPSCFWNIHINIIFSFTPKSSKLSSSLRVAIHATCTATLILRYLFIQMTFVEECASGSSSLCSFLQSHLTFCLLGSDVFFSDLFSSTLSLCSFLSFWCILLFPFIIYSRPIIQ